MSDHSKTTTPDTSSLELSAGGDVEAANGQTMPSSQGTLPFATMAIICLSMILVSAVRAMESVLVGNIQTAVFVEFGHLEDIGWVQVGYPLAACCTQMPWSQAFAKFDYKWLYITSLVLFNSGGLLCGLAPTLNALIIGRLLAGLGASGLFAGFMSFGTYFIKPTKRPFFNSLLGLGWAIGSVSGPIVGGAFASNSLTWRWGFYLCIILGGSMLLVSLFLLPTQYHNTNGEKGVELAPFKTRFQQLDWFGMLISSGAICSLIMAITFGGNTYPWGGPQVIVMLTLGSALLVVLIVTQHHYVFTSPQHRIIPLELFADRDFALLTILTLCGSIGMTMVIFYLPLYFQFVQGDSALTAGIKLLPFLGTFVGFVILNGIFMLKISFIHPWFTAGGALTLAGGVLMYTNNEHSSTPQILGSSAVLGSGIGMFVQAGCSIVSLLVPPSQISQASGIMVLCLFIGMVMSVSIGSNLFVNDATTRLQQLFPQLSKDEVQGLISSLSTLSSKEFTSSEQLELVHIIAIALQQPYILVIAAGALAVLGSLGLRRKLRFFKEPSL